MSAMAQDILVKRSGERLNVKVLSISKRKVKYVRQGTDTPVYSLNVSEIEYIQYPMGDRDTFGKSGVITQQQSQQQSQPQQQQQPQPPQQGGEIPRWHGQVPAPEGAPRVESLQSAPQPTYSIGEIYEKDGVRGIVVLLSDGGRHGTIMSLDEACLEWCDDKNRDMELVGAASATDGRENMESVAKYIARKGVSWDYFPAFRWCRSKGEGWYLPALNEIWSAGNMYLGGSRKVANRRLRKVFNTALKEAGGKEMSNTMYYFSSTEDKDMRCAHYTHMSTEPPFTNTEYKSAKLFVRAFYRF